jgi:outer membrane protein
MRTSFVSALAATGSFWITFGVMTAAHAQPAPAPAPGPQPDVAQPAGPADRTQAVPGGVTAEQVGARAMATSYEARAAQETARGAEARAKQTWTNYLPQVGLTARYTRLSPLTLPQIDFGGDGRLVGTPAEAGTPNPSPTIAVDLGGGNTEAIFPIILDNYLLQATVAVPISDYFLRITQAYTAATRAEEAARWDIIAARTRSYADGKIAYFTWLRARGAVGVAEQTLAVAQAHLRDAQNQFAVGNASRADVLRAETQVAAAELAVERAKSGVVVTETQIRVAMHAREGERLEPGDPLDTPLSPAPPSPKPLVAEALAQRPEIKSIDKNAEAARRQAGVARAGRYPTLSAFGDVTYANPNQRRIPLQREWFPTWAAGAQLTWTTSDVFAAGPASNEAEARAAALEAQKGTVRDGIELEVTQAYQDLRQADFALDTTNRQLESALEGYRVARELFNAGRGTSTTLIDAENALAQSRFDHLNARVDARLARIRLEHALGRDTRVAAGP